jgi:hypothetical protein
MGLCPNVRPDPRRGLEQTTNSIVAPPNNQDLKKQNHVEKSSRIYVRRFVVVDVKKID